MAACSVGPTQNPASAVAGNIGKVVSKVMVWDHDPFLARPTQQTGFTFSQDTAEALQDPTAGVQFELGTVFLKPTYVPHDMFVATRNANAPSIGGEEVATRGLDFVGSPESGVGQVAIDKMPGGTTYDVGHFTNPNVGEDIFPHQLWIYEGSLLKRGVPVHPSEYSSDLSEIQNAQNILAKREAETPEEHFQKFTLTEIQSAPRWDYTLVKENGVETVWPVMVSKQVPDLTTPVHWTLKKFTPLWQGEDFFVTILINKGADAAVDKKSEHEIVSTNWEQYKYLMYALSTSQQPVPWFPGISNQAFYMNSKSGSASNEQPIEDPARKEYWWKFKTYILIEIGVDHYQHNYFIEFCEGRKPRFLALGEEWTDPLRSGEADQFRLLKKCRELSVYDAIYSDDLFKAGRFRVSVRNHLGRLVVTLSGYEANPWVIERLDNKGTSQDEKILAPMVVPAAKVAIHGGNISCAVNFSPTKYPAWAAIPFTNLQADTFRATNRDLYMTCSHMATSVRYESRAIERFFNDPRFGKKLVGYDCDAFGTTECIKNVSTFIPIYEFFDSQFRSFGKGYVLAREGTGDAPDPETGLFPPHTLINKIDFDGNRHHEISIYNLRSDRPFQFSLTDQANANYPYKDYVSKWDVEVRLWAGTVLVPPPDDPDATISGQESEVPFIDYVTPIATSWRLIVLGGEKPVAGSNIQKFDIAPLVTSINDSWSTEGYTTMNHETKIKCYIPLGVPTGGDPQSTTLTDQQNLYALGQKLLKLHNKSFYVTVSYWWEDGVGKRTVPGNRLPRRPVPREDELLIAMTGIAYGATIERSVNKIYMDFTIKDYMSAMQKQMIFNSPFFDGVSDALAVYELAKLAGFDDNRQRIPRIDRRPLGFLQHVMANSRNENGNRFIYNGEQIITYNYDLPGRYASFVDPHIRFQNGESYESALKKIAQFSGKIIYFDRWGVLRLESNPAIQAAFSSSTNPSNDIKPIFNFVTTPFPVTPSGGGGTPINRFVFNPEQHAAHLVYEVVRYTRSVEDAINQLIVITASNNIKLANGDVTGGLVVEGYTFFEQIWDPNAEGFLGFRKPLYQSNGVFGGLEGVRNVLQTYAKFKYPPADVQFQTYGIPGLKPLDVVALDDELFYITEISHEIDPQANRWWCNISGEWLKSFNTQLGFLEDHNPV